MGKFWLEKTRGRLCAVDKYKIRSEIDNIKINKKEYVYTK